MKCECEYELNAMMSFMRSEKTSGVEICYKNDRIHSGSCFSERCST